MMIFRQTDPTAPGVWPPDKTRSGALFYAERSRGNGPFVAQFFYDGREWKWAVGRAILSPADMAEYGHKIVCQIPDADTLLRHEARVQELLDANTNLVGLNREAMQGWRAESNRVGALLDAMDSTRAQWHEKATQARQAVDGIRGHLEVAVRALSACRRIFLLYETMHRAKGTPEGDEKANRNAELAALCKRAMQGDQTPSTPTPDAPPAIPTVAARAAAADRMDEAPAAVAADGEMLGMSATCETCRWFAVVKSPIEWMANGGACSYPLPASLVRAPMFCGADWAGCPTHQPKEPTP